MNRLNKEVEKKADKYFKTRNRDDFKEYEEIRLLFIKLRNENLILEPLPETIIIFE